MTTLEKFNRAVITALYPECKTYEEAIKKEIYELYCPRCGDGRIETQAPITIGRVMQAFWNKNSGDFAPDDVYKIYGIITSKQWKLTKENGQEADSTCQSEETLLKILELLK